MNRWIFRAVKLLLMIKLDTFVKTHRMYNTKSEPKCKLQT